MSLVKLGCILCILQYAQALSCDDYFSSNNVDLIVGYADWRHIRYVVILEENIRLGCNLKQLKKYMYKFTNRNLYLSTQSSMNTMVQLLKETKFKPCVVTFFKSQSSEEFLAQANKITLHGDKVAWLIILLAGEDSVLEHVRLANFGLDADVMLAVGTLRPRTQALHKVLKVTNFTRTKNGVNFTDEFGEDEEVDTSTPFLFNSSSYDMLNFCNVNVTTDYCMIQLYKIRKFDNNSLVVYHLGSWSAVNESANLKHFLTTEKRGNFFKLPLIFGSKNFTDTINNENVIEDDDEDETVVQQYVPYFASLLNASENLVTFSKLGNKNSDGEWTDLFKAIVKEEVDIGVDSIIMTPERDADMAFTYKIMESRRSIYIKPQESNELRDIFLVPFDLRLIKCVVGTGALLALLMATYKKIMKRFLVAKHRNEDCRLSDSVMWSVGVFSQQGSVWKPKSYTEQIIIIVSLAFTLIIYNSYSAFITSVLSVKLTDIRTVEDLLNSDYEIGYAKNSQDEIYLRSMNITQLNEIYLRGYLHNEISNVTEGLLKAAKGNYGFFASSHIARKKLLIINNYKCKYDIAEIPIKDVVNYIAFPMSKRSPYKKLINLSIIKMYETGVYKYICPLLYPDLQKCQKRTTYQSARLPDLMTAFGIFALGIVSSCVVIIMECLWKRRKSIYLYFEKRVRNQKPVQQGY